MVRVLGRNGVNFDEDVDDDGGGGEEQWQRSCGVGGLFTKLRFKIW